MQSVPIVVLTVVVCVYNIGEIYMYHKRGRSFLRTYLSKLRGSDYSYGYTLVVVKGKSILWVLRIYHMRCW